MMRGFSSTRTRSPTFATRLPDWIKRLERPAAPVLMPKFGPLAGIRAVGTGVLVAQPYIGTKLAEFGAEVIHVERPGGDTFRFTAPLLTRGPSEHGCDEAEIAEEQAVDGHRSEHARGVELLMALWKISDIWMEFSAPGTMERAGCTATRVGDQPPSGHREGQHLWPVRPQGVPRSPRLRRAGAGLWRDDERDRRSEWAAAARQGFHWRLFDRADRLGRHDDGAVGGKKTGRGQVIDLAQFEAVAQTRATACRSTPGKAAIRTHRQSSAGFPTLRYIQVRRRLGVYRGTRRPICEQIGDVPGARSGRCTISTTVSKDAAAVNSEKGRDFDRRLRDYCAARPRWRSRPS